ncbi:glucose-6-phosphate dehydrogenase [Microbacterium sp. zg.B48]|uniref:glucose-6-phosphate dehydrogenase n=1 Tax=Microbacterium sp. zg.B48 TaxID=2969408 RepID=UPI00214A9F81|nr:glucose-6-phosphate dehydrogenase [Microbacterium sp. zg.B48]MCR2762397.1 glucose-6-phosphate dehydrogenase [Microbacterium sp. zg.B48]
MTKRNVPESVSILILGAGGDLTKRLLLPGLASLLSAHDYDVQVLGAAQEERTDEQWRQLIRDSFGQVTDPQNADRYLESARYITADVTDPEQLRLLIQACDHTPIIYFALPPAVTARVCAALRQLDLPAGTRLALEKPFGTDLTSARALNRLIAQLVPEEQVFRIDHFLGMSMVLNILGLRFANQFFESVWNGRRIERIEIVYDELLGLEGRGGYYDRAGALIDMLQSHLLEVLALIAMEQPPRLNEVELRSNAAQILRATHVWGDDPAASSHRARYTAGKVGDRSLPSYTDEPGVDPALKTETLAQVTLEVDTARWRGVPFVLRSGKAIGNYTTQVRVRLRPVPEIPGFGGAPAPDSIMLDLKSGAVELGLTMNGSGDPFTLERSTLVAKKELGDLLPYGQVLQGIVEGDPLLSVRADMAEECWRIFDPVISAWRKDEVPLEEYPAGSLGPKGW